MELVEPVSPPTIYHDFLDQHGEGLRHVGFDVADLDAAVEQAHTLGINVMASGRTTGGLRYSDTTKAGGAIVEVIQRKARRAPA